MPGAGYRSSGKIRAASRLSTTVPVALPGDGKKYELQLFTLFRPLCPAVSFADVDTYAMYHIECRKQTSYQHVTRSLFTMYINL